MYEFKMLKVFQRKFTPSTIKSLKRALVTECSLQAFAWRKGEVDMKDSALAALCVIGLLIMLILVNQIVRAI